MNLPAGRFIITVPPHFLQVNTIYEIIFEVSGLPSIEDNHWHASQDKKDFFFFFCFFFNSSLRLAHWRSPVNVGNRDDMDVCMNEKQVILQSLNELILHWWIQKAKLWHSTVAWLYCLYCRNKLSYNFAHNPPKLLIGFFIFHFLNPFVQLQVKYCTTFTGKRTNFTS